MAAVFHNDWVILPDLSQDPEVCVPMRGDDTVAISSGNGRLRHTSRTEQQVLLRGALPDKELRALRGKRKTREFLSVVHWALVGGLRLVPLHASSMLPL